MLTTVENFNEYMYLKKPSSSIARQGLCLQSDLDVFRYYSRLKRDSPLQFLP